MISFGSVCDGIGCGHLGFVRAGFTCLWSAEIEAFPCGVLDHRFSDVTNHGDMNLTAGLVASGEIEAPDVFIGGTPCQAFSVAGKRKGLEDARGNLSLTFCGIADAIDDVRARDGKQPCVVLWENVPGVLSDKGNAFGCFLGELAGSGCELQPPGGRWSNAGCVFGPRRAVAWRVLDSQWFGVAQRRRRVFVVASAGDGTRPEEILFEREGVRRDSPPSREKGQGVAGTLSARTQGGGGLGTDFELAGGPIAERCGETRGQDPVVAVMAHGQANAEITKDICPTLNCNHEVPIATYDMRGNGDGKTVGCLTGDHAGRPTDYTPVVCVGGEVSHTLKAEGHDASEDGTGRGCPVVAFERRFVRTTGGQPVYDLHPCLRADANSGDGAPCVATPMFVRRLTPVECERLQGLSDNWTLIPWRGKPPADCPDGPRYKAIGNGQTVTVMEWLANRIKRGLRK